MTHFQHWQMRMILWHPHKICLPWHISSPPFYSCFRMFMCVRVHVQVRTRVLVCVSVSSRCMFNTSIFYRSHLCVFFFSIIFVWRKCWQRDAYSSAAVSVRGRGGVTTTTTATSSSSPTSKETSLEHQASNYPEQHPRDTLNCIIDYLEEICGPYGLLKLYNSVPLAKPTGRRQMTRR